MYKRQAPAEDAPQAALPQDSGQFDGPHHHRGLAVAIEHARLYAGAFGQLPYYYFLPMRKHLAWYAHHLPGAGALRRQLLQVHSADEAVAVLDRYLDYRRQWQTA